MAEGSSKKRNWIILTVVFVAAVVFFAVVTSTRMGDEADMATPLSQKKRPAPVATGRVAAPEPEAPPTQHVETAPEPPRPAFDTRDIPDTQAVILPPGDPCPDDDFTVYIDEALQALRKNLPEKDKERIMRKIEMIVDPMVMPVVMLALEDESDVIRHSAIEAIRPLDHPCVVPAVEKALEDEDAIIRQDAVEALLRVKDESINDALIKALQDTDEDVRETALEVMLFQEDPCILPAAEAAVQMPDVEMQKEGISILEDIPSSSAVDAIINYGLLSDHDDARKTAVQSLQEMSGEKFTSYKEWDAWWAKTRNACPVDANVDEWDAWWDARKRGAGR